ncbi:AAA family ATPase [Apiospora saccharicola]|uniref:AAA family ATPase n=1 Tax=Apiospora saccharicola TaxID=335842 RepID=A0ABR1VPG4_9PEZI
METHLAHAFALRRMIRDRQLQKIGFADLWHLFNPGDLVVNHVSSKDTRSYAYQIFCVTGGRRDAEVHGQLNPLLLRAVAYEYNGVSLGPAIYHLEIQPYSGEKLITDLNYFPKQFAADGNRIQYLLDRGHSFIKSRYGLCTYEGSVSHDNQFVEGEFFVDFKSGYESETAGIPRPKMNKIMAPSSSRNETDYYQDGPDMLTTRYIFDQDEKVDVGRCEEFLKDSSFPRSTPDGDIDKLEEERLLLLPDSVLGFSLRTKEWCKSIVICCCPTTLMPVLGALSVSHVRMLSGDQIQRTKPFDSLVIPGPYKRILKAMVEDHTESQNRKQSAASGRDLDLVRGKGRGLVIFLYGPPGVGKTSTAETIAAYTTPPRPLYPITCGDLGTTPDQIQQRLQFHFRLAHRWNCVLLLDEADVYLVERDINDIKRNGIVSVFLRTLEYYSGILFLTSNREGSIDEAFKSRIHIALHYKRINSDGNTQIWNNMFDRVEQTNQESDKKLPIVFDREKLLAWAKKHFERHDSSSDNGGGPNMSKFSTWNGRQVRNAFQTAIALASYDRLEKLGEAKLTSEQAMKKSRWRKVHLLPSHFDRVEEVVGDFQQYLDVVRKPDHVRAQTRGLRNDDWDGQPRQPPSAYARKSNTHRQYAPPTASRPDRPPLRDPRLSPSKAPMRPAKLPREVPPHTVELDEDYVNEAYDDPYGDGSDSEEEQEMYNQSGTNTDVEG